MKSIFAITVLSLLVLGYSTMIPHLGKPHGHNPKVYKLQLNDPPIQRWQSIVPDFKDELHKFINIFDLLPLPKLFFDAVGYYGEYIFQYPEFYQETEGIAQAAGLPKEKIFFLNFMYEFSTFKACSGIIVRNSNNTIIHGRNLDFEFWNIFSRLLARVEFYRGDQLVFQTDQVIGSVFVMTGMKPGLFAINEDTRKSSNFLDVLKSLIFENHIPSAYLIRKVLEEENSWQAAFQRLNSTLIAAPVYYIVSGVESNEGCVIEREPNGPHGIRCLNESTWFLVQTNYDSDQKQPWYDRREAPAEKRIQDIGQDNFSIQDMFSDVITKWPSFNIATIMSAVMSAGSSYHNTTVWYGSNN